jgi:hypothetical protein
MSNTPPFAETPEDNARSNIFATNQVVLGLLLLAHAAVGAYFTPTKGTLFYLTFGIRISQPVLLATWAAFGRQRFYYRLLWSLLICTY